MTEMELREEIRRYEPFNEQEREDKEEILRQMEQADHILTRDNRNAHITVSAWIMDRDRKKVLMAYHNLYQSWAWLGGHADGDADLKAVALKEIREESGLESVRFVTEDIFSLEILTVDGHEKRGSYVPSHLHLNVSYLLETDEEEVLRIKPDENSGVRWFSLEEALAACSEPWMIERVYKKLNAKVRERFGGTYGMQRGE